MGLIFSKRVWKTGIRIWSKFDENWSELGSIKGVGAVNSGKGSGKSAKRS